MENFRLIICFSLSELYISGLLQVHTVRFRGTSFRKHYQANMIRNNSILIMPKLSAPLNAEHSYLQKRKYHTTLSVISQQKQGN